MFARGKNNDYILLCLQDVEQVGVFKICLNAELIPAEVHTYRDKLVHLRRLDHGTVQNQLPVGEQFQQVSVHVKPLKTLPEDHDKERGLW